MTGSDGSWRRSALFTDLYQLVMAQLYVEEGLAERPAKFDWFYRSNPDYGNHQAGFCVFAGLEPLLDWMATVTFTDDDLAALAEQHDPAGNPRFGTTFLDWLADHGHFRDVEVSGMAEGRVIHPHEPVLTVTGPLAAAQLLETALLNQCNYPTLVATKAARVAQSARGAGVLEFGMRRGPGSAVDEAARAALIGGCSATSNVQASAALGTDPRGTHAHSLVQAYLALGLGELEAFRAFARRYPDECLLLVDTIDTLRSGVPNAITVFEELHADGHEPAGIRLDSGDLAHLAVESAQLLDDAGFENTKIVLSGELDEITIWQVLTQIADDAERQGFDAERVRRRLVYGVGTRLITSAGDASLGGVYKLTAIADEHGAWEPAVKLSESQAKVPIIGPKRTWRIHDQRGKAIVDVLMGPDEEPFSAGDVLTLHHPFQPGIRRTLHRDEVNDWEELHLLLLAGGRRVGDPPTLENLQERRRRDVDRLDTGVRRLVNPHVYHVSLSDELHRRQRETIERMQQQGFA
ncbi:MAG: nicotinate phosphoribosyltransferase [Acidimicrobiales bacterium]|nr:nicotinate phosphoribosyltransferase [Acidimicrobiales bacterium]